MSFVPRHFAVLAPPTPGHLNPLQVLGGRLVAHGHRVTIVHLDAVHDQITDPAIGFAAIADPGSDRLSLSTYLAHLAAPTGFVGLGRMIQTTAAMSDLLLDRAPPVLAEIGADIVLADSAEPAGALIAERLGLPYIATVTGLPLLAEPGVPPPFLGWRYRADAIGRFRNGGGYGVANLLMRPVTRTLDRRRQIWRLAAQPPPPLVTVAQCPRGLDYPRTQLPAGFQYGGPWRDASGETLALPADDRPLVFCSLGTLQGARFSVFATVAAACAAIGGRAVIGHGGGLSEQEAAALPGDPLVRAFWPQQQVLGQAVAAVLHGGFNSVLDALAASVPIVALPIAFEQPGTAARIAWTGAGLIVSPSALTVDRLARALQAVIRQPSYRTAARRLSREIANTSGAAGAVAAIEAALATLA